MRRKYRPVLAFRLKQSSRFVISITCGFVPVHNRLPLVLLCKGVYSEIETPAFVPQAKLLPLLPPL